MHTLLIPRELSRNYYLDDPNGAGGGEPAGDPAPAEGGDGFQIPEKFQGKSLEDVVKSYSELEKQLGQKSQTPDVTKIIDSKFNELRQALESKNTTPTEDDELRKSHKEYLKSLGVPTMEDVTQAEEKGYKKAMLALTAKELESKYNGSDGKPKFSAQEIAQYAMNEAPEWLRGAPLEAVYEYKHKADLEAWKIADAIKRNKAPSVPSGTKTTPHQSKPIDPSNREAIRASAIARLEAQNEA